jgi:brefeldin A-inhibited guanine nucleotide-exchange protein
VFPSADTAFILAFSIIMLNTDLHNPSIRDDRRMTKETFIKQNRGIAGGGDVDPDILVGIFGRIKLTPFSLKEDDDLKKKLDVDDKVR